MCDLCNIEKEFIEASDQKTEKDQGQNIESSTSNGSITPRTIRKIESITLKEFNFPESKEAIEVKLKQKLFELEVIKTKLALINDNISDLIKNNNLTKQSLSEGQSFLNAIKLDIKINVQDLARYKYLLYLCDTAAKFKPICASVIKYVEVENSPETIRYCLENINIQMISDVNIPNGCMYAIEMVTFLRAIRVLMEREKYNATMPLYSKNVVIVDMFARARDGINLALDSNKNIEIHSICLYKEPKENKFLIIDPSNVVFSEFIGVNLKELFGIEIVSAAITGDKIYNPKDNEDYIKLFGDEDMRKIAEEKAFKPRDCVDICVKLGFEINKQQRKCQGTPPVGNEVVSSAVGYVTNQSLPCKSILFQSSKSKPKDIEKTLLFDAKRQSSSDIERDAANQWLRDNLK